MAVPANRIPIFQPPGRGVSAPSRAGASPRSFSTDPRHRPRLTRERLAVLHANETAIAARLEQTLNRGRCRAALISRAGCDLTRFRFEGECPSYTHTGFVIRERGEWRVHQLLNTHGGAEGHLYWQSIVDFFRDDPYEYRCAVLVPSRTLQDRIAAILRSPLVERLYTPRYSRVAYPLSTRYQNSNQWVAELIGAAQSSCVSRGEVQRHLAGRGLSPSILRSVGCLTQAVVALTAKNTRFDDHPLRNRLAGRIAFVTETSIRDYLRRTDRIELEETITVESSEAADFPVGAPVAAAC